MRRLALSVIVFAALALHATALSAQRPLEAVDSVSRAALRDSVAHARARWETARPPLYRVSVDFRCECARPLDNEPWVLVRGDSILHDSTRVDQRAMVEYRPEYYTIDGLFRALEAAVNDTRVDVRAVRFDPTYGIPLSFHTQVRCRNGRCVSGGFTDVRVRGFEVVQAAPPSFTQYLPARRYFPRLNSVAPSFRAAATSA